MCARRLWGWFWIQERKRHFFPQHTLHVVTTIKLIFLNSLVLYALFSQNVSKHISWEWDSITDRGKPNTISKNVKRLLVISLTQCIQSVKKNDIHCQALIIPLPPLKPLSHSYLTRLPSWHKSNTKRGVKKKYKTVDFTVRSKGTGCSYNCQRQNKRDGFPAAIFHYAAYLTKWVHRWKRSETLHGFYTWTTWSWTWTASDMH